MSTLTLNAPAKLNLSLRVLGKRPDGYHDLSTLMVKIPQLADQLHFTPAPEFHFSCDDPTLPTDDRNLVVRAAKAYQHASGIAIHWHITLAKAIPHEAGLGGGSSDAAATLAGLDELNGYLLGTDRLASLAASLGSDVPFFLTPGAALCTGRGEHSSPVPTPPALPIVVLKPRFGVATASAYAAWQSAKPISGVPFAPQTVGNLTLVNDLELPVFQKYRFLPELKKWLLARREVTAALLCGSGSALFAILHDLEDGPHVAAAAKHELDPTLWSWTGSI